MGRARTWKREDAVRQNALKFPPVWRKRVPRCLLGGGGKVGRGRKNAFFQTFRIILLVSPVSSIICHAYIALCEFQVAPYFGIEGVTAL